MSSDAEVARAIPRHRRAAAALLACCRPRQWVKNLLVLIAPLAAGVIQHPPVLWRVLAAFAAFVLASSAVYLVNDLKDVVFDRLHPVKRNRPIASGQLPVRVARAAAPLLVLAALAVALATGWQLAGIVALYVASSVLYCYRMKHEVVLDLVFVLTGFLLRAIGGGVAAGVSLSQWFLLTAGLGALFVVAGKRYAERVLAERTDVWSRPVLRAYSLSYLRFVWTIAAAALLVTYSLWTFTVTGHGDDSRWSVLSILPFVIVLLRYALIVDRGGAGEPEDIVAGDRTIQLSGALWMALVLVAVYR